MRTVRLLACIGFCAAPPLLAADYTLLATPETVAWGYYSGTAKAALTVHSGETVRMQTLSTCGSPEQMISQRSEAGGHPALHRDYLHREVKDIGPGGHILTGPVAIAEAEPGDVLEVQILKVDLDVDSRATPSVSAAASSPWSFPTAATRSFRSTAKKCWPSSRRGSSCLCTRFSAAWGWRRRGWQSTARRHSHTPATWTTRSSSPAQLFTFRSHAKRRAV